MSGFVKYEECPKCSANGRDRAGDNLGVYSDGHSHCFSCGYHLFPTHYVAPIKDKDDGSKNKAVLPADFTRDIPAEGWKWLLQYKLPYSYWKPFAGYSPRDERLVLTVGTPTRFSIGRYIGDTTRTPVLLPRGPEDRENVLVRTPRKWYNYGDRRGYVEILGEKDSSEGKELVVVEDYVSQHKVAQVTPALCLFGTNISEKVLQVLKASNRPVALWLDRDQYTLLPPKINRLQTFLEAPVRYLSTEKDPKMYNLDEIKEILK